MLFKAKVLVPFALGSENSDLLDYVGFVDAGMTYVFKKDKLYADVLLKKGAHWDWKGALQVQLVYNPFKSANQYFMVQWFQSYGEGLLDYDKKTSRLRFGIIIKPNFMNFF